MEDAIIEVTRAGAALARIDKKIEALKSEREQASDALKAASDRLSAFVSQRKGAT